MILKYLNVADNSYDIYIYSADKLSTTLLAFFLTAVSDQFSKALACDALRHLHAGKLQARFSLQEP
jgi:hypothetical protein